MNKKSLNIEICHSAAPLSAEKAWEIESLLLKIFEYTDYSLRSTLLGRYSETLNCRFFTAKLGYKIIGAAVCLYSQKNPTIAIIGPVGITEKYRRTGIGTKLIDALLRHLTDKKILAAYLGVNADSPAVKFYRKLGFQRYKGIVMRHLFCTRQYLEENLFTSCNDNDIKIRPAVWGDLPATLALLCFPCRMYTANLPLNLFSSRYIKPSRFLPLFRELIPSSSNENTLTIVLAAGPQESIVGIANIRKYPDKARAHLARLDFFVHDNFLKFSRDLVKYAIRQSARLKVDKLLCFCLACDNIKKSVIESLSPEQLTLLPDNVFINNSFEDTLIYQFERLC